MADFAEWIEAAESALPWPRGEFLKTYGCNREDANALALEATPVASELQNLGDFEGTAAQLLETLNGRVDENVRKLLSWPKSPRGLSGLLRRIAPNLRAVGVAITFVRAPDSRRRRIIAIRRYRKSSVQIVRTVQTLENTGSPVDGSDAKPLSSDGRLLRVDGEVDGRGPL